MPTPIHSQHARRIAIALAAGCALVALPTAAQAATPVNLATAAPFVVLGGSTVTNTGPSVLNGALGVAPGTSLVGFALPAVVNGATHDNDAVASQAQSDLTTAYTVAAGEPVAPANDLTGQDLGGLTLTAGNYGFSTSAQLTGQVTLDAQGNPNAQFVFEIGSTLTTASASSVVLINGASPCNVYWQVGSSATLGSTTAFQGNVMALDSVSLNSGASVQGRVLARNGAVTLDDNVLSNSSCTTSSTTTGTTTKTPGASSTTTSGGSGTGSATTGTGGLPPASQSTIPTRKGTAFLARTQNSPTGCQAGYSATVHGREIKHITFRLDGKMVAGLSSSPFRVSVNGGPGAHSLTARVTFKDATPTKTLKLGYHACAATVRPTKPIARPGESQFTG